jgi:hypothetical protein
VVDGETVALIHQEDVAQALGLDWVNEDGTVSDEFSTVMSEPKFGRQGMPVVLASEPVGPPGEARLENMGRMRPASRQVPLVAEPGKQQLRLVPGEHRAALIV